MPRYYCDYCDTYLTHDSPSVRKQHNAGYKHKANVRSYYQQFEEQQTQSLIDQRIKEHLGQAAAFQQQVGASFNQHLMSLQANPQRARLPILPSPLMPFGAPQGLLSPQMIPGVRLPLLPRPISGYPGAPGAPPSMAPHGAGSMPMLLSSLPRPPMLAPPTSGVSASPAPNVTQTMYQTDPSASLHMAPTIAPGNAQQDGFSFAQSSETNH